MSEDLTPLMINGEELDRAFPAREWQAPNEVDLTTNDRGDLALRAPFDGPSRRMTSTRGLLSEFRRITTPEDAHRFARTWGLLGRPFSGEFVSHRAPFLYSYGPEEKIEDWLSLRAQISAILRNAARVSRAQPLDATEWKSIVLRTTTTKELREEWADRALLYVEMISPSTLEQRIQAVHDHVVKRGLQLMSDGIDEYIASRAFYLRSVDKLLAFIGSHLPEGATEVTWEIARRALGTHEQNDIREGTAVGYSRIVLEFAVQELLADADVRPLVRWDGNRKPQIEFGSPSRTLFAVLALQVATAFCRTELAICAGCRSEYTPRRRPRFDRANYCPTCQKNGVAQREAENRRQNERALKKSTSTTRKRDRRRAEKVDRRTK